MYFPLNYATEYNIARKMLFTRWARFPFAGRVRTLRRILDLENRGVPPRTEMYAPLANLANWRFVTRPYGEYRKGNVTITPENYKSWAKASLLRITFPHVVAPLSCR